MASPHSGRTYSKGGHWDRKAGTHHYHNQGTALNPLFLALRKRMQKAFTKSNIPKSWEAEQR
ncbi:hypothetical protein [Candidatus Pelagisphaera phototrophica]|uniref:hypothetical protein n=1 Tax=Candidatus Pelagisphaera phototrophica TaxID=2684113 RepID=UPI0024B6C9B4|nr:hypothetical protein [Candidatus Pelagisphaera phototrophica]QXD31061.1 hypothetical protein GA004_12005 [Candidatus Pelagisphaera phototrophica]